MKFILLIILMSFKAANAAPNNYMTYLGGGGEPLDATTTQFDAGLRNFSSFVKDEAKNYNVTVNFNGGHSETESMINAQFKDQRIINNFTKQSFDKMIEEYTTMLEKDPPQIPVNGKILIFINSHGGEKKGETHEISAAKSVMTNLNTGSTDGMISLDGLAKLTALAEKKNIKMAIIDGSCHSGNSLQLANTKTCVIAASGPKHYGFSNFAENFASRMKKGENLEQIFLDTREDTEGNGFPQISTPEGTEVQDEIYPLLTPFMYFHDEYRGVMLDKIDIYLKENAETYEANFCGRQNDFHKLNEILKFIEDVTAIEAGLFKKTKKKTVNLDALREQIRNYKNVQENYLKKLSEISMGNLQKKEKIIIDESTYTKLTHEEIIGPDWNIFINEKIADLRDTNLTAERRKSLEESKLYYTKVQEKKLQVLRDYPEYQRYENIINTLKTDTAANTAIASNIAKEAHLAYAAYYKKKQEERRRVNKSATNPCRDFVL